MSKAERVFKLKQKRSVLDTYIGEFKRLQKTVMKEDREKLAEYSNAIRTMEADLSKEREWFNIPFPKATMKEPNLNIRSGSSEEHKLFYDLMAVALQTGQTNVISYRLSCDGLMEEVGYKGHIHSLNHMRGDMDLTFGEKKDQKLMENYSYFISKLKSLKESDGTSVFDNCAVSIGSSTRSQHTTKDLPLIVSGSLQGKIKQGQQIIFDEKTPGKVSDVWLALLQKAGCPVKSFSTSESAMSELV